MARIVTGIKPTGTPHLGNYLGMIRPALELASEHEAYDFVADHHALNTAPDPDALHQRSIEIAATLLALGLEPSRTALYRQSAVPEVFELASLLTPVTPTRPSSQRTRGRSGAPMPASTWGCSPTRARRHPGGRRRAGTPPGCGHRRPCPSRRGHPSRHEGR